MFGSYSVCNIIVLLNMLIAMMSNSFQVSEKILKNVNFIGHFDLMRKNLKEKELFETKSFPPTPGIEPGPPGWKPGILAIRPRGIAYFSFEFLKIQIFDK